MKIFKKVMLSILIVGSSGSMLFGMEYVGLWYKFYEAASNGYEDKVKSCLEKLKDSDLRSFFVRAKDDFGYTALFYATMHNHENVVILLLAAIKNPEERTQLIESSGKSKQTPLHCAAINGNANLVKILIEVAQDPEQKIALITATRGGNLTALDLVIMHVYTDRDSVDDKYRKTTSTLLEYYQQLTIQIPKDLVPKLKELGFLE